MAALPGELQVIISLMVQFYSDKYKASKAWQLLRMQTQERREECDETLALKKKIVSDKYCENDRSLSTLPVRSY